MTDLRQRVEALEPKFIHGLSSKEDTHFGGGYDQCKADVLALLDGAEGTEARQVADWLNKNKERVAVTGRGICLGSAIFMARDNAIVLCVDNNCIVHSGSDNVSAITATTHTTPRGEA